MKHISIADRVVLSFMLAFLLIVSYDTYKRSHFVKDNEQCSNNKIIRYDGFSFTMMDTYHLFQWNKREVGTYREVDTCIGGETKYYKNIAIESCTICGVYDIKNYYK